MGKYGTYKTSGIPIRDQVATTGSAFYVDSTTGNDVPEQGSNPNRPFATVDYAVGKCTANKGDVIYVMPNHVETLAAAGQLFDIDVAGVSVIGIGNGTNVPEFNLNHADAETVVGASNVLLSNLHFVSDITLVKIGIDVEAGSDNVVVEDCRFSVTTDTTDEFLIAVNVGVVSNMTVRECYFDAGLGGAAHGIKLVGACTGFTITDNLMKGDYSVACIGGITTASTDGLIKDNILINGSTGDIGTVACVSMLTATEGLVIGNEVFCNVATVDVMMLADTMIFSRNYASEDVGEAADSIVWGAATSVTQMADG